MEARIISPVPPSKVNDSITTVLVAVRKGYDARVLVTSEATTNFAVLLLLVVPQLRHVLSFARGILTKPIKLPSVKVTVNVTALRSIIIRSICICRQYSRATTVEKVMTFTVTTL